MSQGYETRSYRDEHLRQSGLAESRAVTVESPCLRCLFRDRAITCLPPSWHRLGPVHVPLEAKRCRHVAVAIPIVAIGDLIAFRPCQQRAQPQQPDVAQNQTLVGWRGRQPVDRGLGVNEVAVGTALQQRLHQNAGRRDAIPAVLIGTDPLSLRTFGVWHRRGRRTWPAPARPTRRGPEA
jgi:hypothetical protein